MTPAARTRTLVPPEPVDLALTLAPLHRGRGDPTMRFAGGAVWRSWRSGDGPVTLHLARDGDRIAATAWGTGAEAALDALPGLLGLDDGARLFAPAHPLLRALQRRFVGLRLGRTGAVLDALVPAVLEQHWTWIEAWGTLRRLIREHGEPAPGPPEAGLHLLPAPGVLASLPSFEYGRLGIGTRRATTLRHIGALAGPLEEAAMLSLADAYRRLRAIPGIGPWTAAEVGVRALGDRDAVSVGDFHLPHLVAWALAGEARADDARMLELLAPYRGQRARVVRLLEASGITPPRFGPRAPLGRTSGPLRRTPGPCAGPLRRAPAPLR